jgi:hypothetical protein
MRMRSPISGAVWQRIVWRSEIRMPAGASSGHGSTLPYRSRTATMTSLHAKGYGNALALPCWSGETGETGNYLGKVDRPLGVTAPV